MAYPTLVLWCDATRNKLIQGWQSNQLAQKPVLKQGDSIGVEIHWVTYQGTGMPSEVIFPPSSNVTLAIGQVDASPTGGSYTLSYNRDTTDELPFDATATQIETALNDLASITAEGGVSVERVGITNRIVWDDAGAYTSALTCDPDGLSPTTNDNIAQLREGTAAVRRIILFSLKQAPIAACTTFSATPAPTLTVSSIYTNTWRITLDGQPKAGSFKVVIQVGVNTYKTTPLSLFSSDADIALALNALLAEDSPGSFTAVSNYSGLWDVTAPSSVKIDGGVTGGVVSMSVEADIVAFSSLYGLLDMNTVNVEEFLSGYASRDAVLEIEVDASSEVQTIAQTPVTLVNDLINASVFDLVSMGQVMPVDSVVRWDTPQVITSSGQLQARTNIAAAGASEIAALQAEDISLSGRIGAIESFVDQDVTTTGTPTFGTVYNYVSSGDLGVRLVNGGIQGKLQATSPITDWATGQRFYLNAEEGFALYDDSGANTTISPAYVSIARAASSISLSDTGITFPDSSVQTTAFVASSFLAKADNLAGLTSTSTARSNLGLGTMATETASNYLTTSAASSNYLTILAASTTYALQSSFDQGLLTTDTPAFSGLTVNGTLVLAAVEGDGGDIAFVSGSALSDITHTAGTVIATGTGTAIKNDDYPDEVQVVINGVTYAMPARVV